MPHDLDTVPLEGSASQSHASHKNWRVLLLFVLSALCQSILSVTLLCFRVFMADGTHVALAAVVICNFELARRVMFCRARVLILRRFTDLSETEIQVACGSRLQNWPLTQTARTSRATKAADVIFRKGGHVTSIIFLFFFHQFVTEASLIVVLSIGTSVITVIQAVCVSHSDSRMFERVACYIFGATDRIRDGKMARINAMSASISLTWGVVISYILGLLFLSDEEIGIAGDLVILPLTFGDALGEIIGTPLGRHKFSVKGFGDVNQKSVEGCLAVFVGSLIPTLIATSFYKVAATTWILCLCVSLLTVFVETVSFRSTDNFTIPVCNSLLILTWAQLAPLVTPDVP